jgi:hypothetical protein
MQQDVEGGHEEISSRHPLTTLPFGAILTFLGVRRRREPRNDGRSATTVAEPAPAVADRRGLYALLTAEGISQVGNTITIVAGPWFVLETTGSAARTGIVSAALAIGGVIPTLLGGPLVDRLGHKRASILADLTSGATIAAVPLLYRAGLLQFWQLVVLVFLLASFNSNGDTARFALIPFLANRAQMPIDRANGPTGRSSASVRSWADPRRVPDRGPRRRQRAVRGHRYLCYLGRPGRLRGAVGRQPRPTDESSGWAQLPS